MVVAALASPRSQAAVQAGASHRDLRVFRHDALRNVLLPQLRLLRPTLLAGQETPTWNDFAALDAATQAIAATAPSQEKVSPAVVLTDDELAAIEQFRADAPAWAVPLPEDPGAPSARYLPNEFELKTLYRKKAAALLKALPLELRPEIRKLPKSDRLKRLTAEAEATARKQEELFDRFFASTGFENIETYEAAMRAKGGKWPELIDYLKNADFDLSMRRPENARWWVPKVGLHNQHVTGTSRGTLDNQKRNRCEASCLGLTYAEYAERDNDFKPKYGSFRPKPGSAFKPSNSDYQYGPDIYILKKSAVTSRTVLTGGDSLGRFVTNAGYSGAEAHTPTTWEHVFIPWKYRTLAAPYMYEEFVRGQVGKTEDSVPADTLPVTWKWGYYVETQAFGPHTLEMVEAFEFTQTPPTGEFLARLVQYGIEIRDGRQWPATTWTPPAP